MNKNKFLLVKGRAGLGNRMLSALTGILYARLSGRKLLVDWSDPIYSSDGSNVFHSFFKCPLFSPADRLPETDSVIPNVWRGRLNESSIAMQERYGGIADSQIWRKFSIDLTKLDYQEDVAVMWTFIEKIDLLRGHFRGAYEELSRASTEAILRESLREYLILRPEIRERVDRFKIERFDRKTVGVHIRYTDHQASLWTIIKRLNALLKREPGLQIFLATDNIQIKNMFEENYSSVISTPHWYPPAGLRLHGKSHPNQAESGVEALVDLYLLAECDYLIIDTSSSFSDIARLLTNAPDSHVINVRRRGKLSRHSRKLLWRIMLKLGVFSWGLNTLSKFVRITKLFSRRLEK